MCVTKAKSDVCGLAVKGLCADNERSFKLTSQLIREDGPSALSYSICIAAECCF